MNKVLKINAKREMRRNRSRATISGTAEKPRLAIFRSNKYTYAQLIDDEQGRTLASASTLEIGAKTKKTEAAKALGTLIAEKAKKAGVKTAVFSRSLYKYHGRVKAVAEGAREGGLKI